VRAAGDAGFSLVEAMVALLVLAVASAGLVGATQAHIDTIRGLEARAAAQWVAENRLVELSLQRAPIPTAEQAVEMLGRNWRVAVQAKPTDDPELLAVQVSVRDPAAAAPTVVMGGFVDAGRLQP
jgi:general secretion pathway protein I